MYAIRSYYAIVYDNKPKVETSYENDRYKGIYEKVYSIVPSDSIIIPSQSISYFDKQSQKVITKKTQEFKIEVENSLNSSQEVVLEKAIRNNFVQHTLYEVIRHDKVYLQKEGLSVNTGYGLLGRVINALGEPIDDKGKIRDLEESSAINKQSMSALERGIIA